MKSFLIKYVIIAVVILVSFSFMLIQTNNCAKKDDFIEIDPFSRTMSFYSTNSSNNAELPSIVTYSTDSVPTEVPYGYTLLSFQDDVIMVKRDEDELNKWVTTENGQTAFVFTEKPSGCFKFTFNAVKGVKNYTLIFNGSIIQPDNVLPDNIQPGQELYFEVCDLENGGKAENIQKIFQLPASSKPYQWYIRAENEFQYQYTKTGYVVFCMIPYPEIKGYESECDHIIPSGGTAMFEFKKLTWDPEPTGQATNYKIEVWEPIYLNDEPQAYFDPVSAYYERFEVGEIEHKRKIGFGEVGNGVRYLQPPSAKPGEINCVDETLGEFKCIQPGTYFWRMKSCNKWGCSQWSEPNQFAYSNTWKESGQAYGIFTIDSCTRGFDITWDAKRIFLSNNGNNMYPMRGDSNVHIFKINEKGKTETLDQSVRYCDTIIGYEEIDADPPGNQIDGICYDDDGNLYFSSGETGYIYRYNYNKKYDDEFNPGNNIPAYTFVTKYGFGIKSSDDVTRNSAFGDIAYCDGKIYATDYNPIASDLSEQGFKTVYTRKLFIIDTKMKGDNPEDYVVDAWPVEDVDKPLTDSIMWGVAVDCCRRYVYVSHAHSEEPKIYRFDLDTASKDVFLEDKEMIQRPLGMAIDSDGYLYIKDGGLSYPRPKGMCIHVYDTKTKERVTSIMKGTLYGWDVDIDKDKNVYANFLGQNQIVYKWVPF